jgi:hypothetical protein
MEGPAVNLSASSTHQLDGAGEHFLRGSPGEREQEDSFWRDAFFQEMRNSVNEGPSLPGAGTGDDQQWAAAKSGCCELLWIQFLCEVP